MTNNPLTALSRLFAPAARPQAPSKKDKDRLAAMLGTNPEALAAFEAAYRTQAIDIRNEQNMFETNSRQASELARAVDPDEAKPDVDMEAVRTLEDRIVDELLAQTRVYDSTRDITYGIRPALPEHEPVTRDDIAALPEPVRPQLSGNLAKRDIAADTYVELLNLYAKYLHLPTGKQRRDAYDLFRQGLDVLDLDGVTYEIIATNRTSMGHWLPKLVRASQGRDFFRIPETKIARVPLTLLQLTRCDYQRLTRTTLDIVDKWAYRTFGLDEDRTYFIKTGTYSSKFDFRNAKVTGAKEVRELGEYLLYIHFQALQMAGPLSTPCIYGASTTVEWVVREFVEDKENNPCIYKGMPLHTEYRVFVDCDTKEILGCVPYWDPDTMKRRFSEEADADSPHQIHDYVIYKAHERVLMDRYNGNKPDVVAHVRELLPDLDLKGQWSIDVMQNGDEFWLIDMAPAEQSAFYADAVPAEKRRPIQEDWMPKLGT